MSPSPHNTKSGVCSHSSPDAWQSFVIFAVDDCLGEENFTDWCATVGLSVTELQGSYKGEEETSYIMPTSEFFGGGFGLSVGSLWCRDQESILHLSKPEKRSRMWRTAYLMYNNRQNTDGPIRAVEHLGYFKQVRKADARWHRSWTHNPNNGGWFICEDNETEYL